MMKLADAGFLLAETPRCGAHVSMLSTWKLPKAATEDFLRDTVQRWRNSVSFAQPYNLRLKPGLLPDWEELQPEQIDLDYHLRHSALPKPGGERELGILASRLHSHSLDRDRPLWEIHIIEGLEHNRFAVFVKMHHSQVDGMGAIRMLERALSPNPRKRNLPPFWETGGPTSTPRATGLRPLPKVGKLLSALGDTYLNRGAQNAIPFDAPKTLFNVRLSRSRRVATQLYEVERLQRIADKAAVSINDVVLCLCAGGLRRYLIEQGELPDKSLTAGVPVSIRDSDEMGNAITFLLAKLHTEQADHFARLQAIHLSTQYAKRRLKKLPDKVSREMMGALLMGPYLGQVGLGLAGRFAPINNLIISNIPGPKRTLYLNGARMEAFYPLSAVMDGQALNITFLRYANHYAVGVTGCRDAVPSLQHIAVYTGETLREMEQALCLV